MKILSTMKNDCLLNKQLKLTHIESHSWIPQELIQQEDYCQNHKTISHLIERKHSKKKIPFKKSNQNHKEILIFNFWNKFHLIKLVLRKMMSLGKSSNTLK